MTVAVLVTGTLFKAPEQRTSGSGRRYVRATLKASAADNAAPEFWDLLAFSETAAAELQRLDVGERVAVQGALKLEIYAPENKPPRIGRTVFVDHALALRAPAKPKKPKTSASPSPPMGRVNILPDQDSPPTGRDELDDDIPF